MRRQAHHVGHDPNCYSVRIGAWSRRAAASVHAMFMCCTHGDRATAVGGAPTARLPYACARRSFGERPRPCCKARRRSGRRWPAGVIVAVASYCVGSAPGRSRSGRGTGQHGDLPLRGAHRVHHRTDHGATGRGAEPRQSRQCVAPVHPSAGGRLLRRQDAARGPPAHRPSADAIRSTTGSWTTTSRRRPTWR